MSTSVNNAASFGQGTMAFRQTENTLRMEPDKVSARNRAERVEQTSREGASTEASAPATGTHAKATVRYLAAAMGCALFAIIYAQFSHDVYSPFMTFMFAIPLVGGALVALVLHITKTPPLPTVARQAWALSIASLCVASCLRGIFEIAGTNSPYLIVYPIIAVVFAIVALVAIVRWRVRR